MSPRIFNRTQIFSARGVRGAALILLLLVAALGSRATALAAAPLPVVGLDALSAFLYEGSLTNSFFRVTRTGDTTEPLTVHYTASGSATNGVDYVRLPGAVTLAAGESAALIAVQPKDNPVEATNKTITLRLATNTAPFTIVVLPDTQYYVNDSNRLGLFERQIKWIVDHKDPDNLVFVLHEGDCTDNNTPFEWNGFKNTMIGLDGVIPYAIAVGNHDGLGTPSNDTALFNSYFPLTNYQGLPTFGGVFESNKLDNTFHRFSAGGVDWLVVSLEFGPRDEVLDWANNVISNEPNRNVILLSHAHVYTDDTLHGSDPSHHWAPKSYGRANDGTDVWEKLVKRHANIRFFFNGHVLNDGAGRVIGTGEHGNTVYQMLANYQMYPNGGNSFLRLIRFDPAQDKFSVKTYSPHQNHYLTWSKQQFEYSNLGIFNLANTSYQISPSRPLATMDLRDDDTDAAPPIALAASAANVNPEIVLYFNEPLHPGTATNILNYEVDQGIDIIGASLALDLRTLTLRSDSVMATGVTYTVTINNIRDRALRPNIIATNTRVPFRYSRVLLSDNFDASDHVGWTVVDEGTRSAPSQWDVRFGRLQQSGNLFGPDVYAVDHRQGTFLYWNKPSALAWSNYSVHATINTPDDDGIGLMFRYQDLANYYKVDFDLQRNFRKLFRVAHGVETTLASEEGGYTQSRDLSVRVEVVTNQITVTLDGTTLFGGPVSDSAPAAPDHGTVALYAWGSDGASFDDVIVTPGREVFRPPPASTNPIVALPPTVRTLIKLDADWMFWPFFDPVHEDWNGSSYDDTSWPGPNKSIFANAPENIPDPRNTSLSLGPRAYYFRSYFNYNGPTQSVCLRLLPLLDDGAIFYLNGQEILRLGMSFGPATGDTLAARDVQIIDYEGPFDIEVTNLVAGTNVFAAELHQASDISEDAVFGVQVEALILHPVPVPLGTMRLLSHQQARLTLVGEAGRVYWIESSPDLREWTRFTSITNPPSGPALLNVPVTNTTARFFRAFLPPASCSER